MTALEDERAAHWVAVKMRDDALAENERLRAVLRAIYDELLPSEQTSWLSSSGKRIMAMIRGTGLVEQIAQGGKDVD